MLSTGSNFSTTRKGIRYGAAASLSLIASAIPLLVHGQTLPEELDVPLRPAMQLPICGKIDSKTTFALPNAHAKQQAEKSRNAVTETEITSETSTKRMSAVRTNADTSANKSEFAAPKTIATQPARKTPVGSFNQAGHVKEYSWLSDNTTVEDEPALKSTGSGAMKNTAESTIKIKTSSSSAKVTARTNAQVTRDEHIEESSSTENNQDTATQTSQEKSKLHETSVSVTKKDRIDPSNVKVAKSPHCSGIADYYADMFHGRKTASGQMHDREKFTAAHRTLPFGTKLKVVNRNTGKACIVTVNDRGPFTKSKIIDLSCAAARELGLMTAKSRLVDCYIVENE
jgi:rare lipoprotein A